MYRNYWPVTKGNVFIYERLAYLANNEMDEKLIIHIAERRRGFKTLHTRFDAPQPGRFGGLIETNREYKGAVLIVRS